MGLLEEVIETFGHLISEWALTACRDQAQRLSDQGRSKDHDQVVRWLEMAWAVATAAGRAEVRWADLDALTPAYLRRGLRSIRAGGGW